MGVKGAKFLGDDVCFYGVVTSEGRIGTTDYQKVGDGLGGEG